MSAIWLLLGLLVLAYTGSMLVGGRAIRGYGLPSGAEYLLLGFVLGPHVLSVAQRSMVAAFEPIATVALGWLALVVGADYGMVGERRVRAGPIVAGMLSSLVTAAAVAGAAGFFAHRVLGLRGLELWILAGGLGIVLSETTRHAIRWVVERHDARGPLSNLLADLADADDAVPLLSLAALFALAPGGATLALPERLDLVARMALPLAAGVVLGLVAALLLRAEQRLHESWGLLLGIALLGIGVASRLEISTLSLMFALGVTLSAASPQRDEIRAMVDATERPVLLPVLLLAGATVDIGLGWRLLALVGVALLARLAVRQFVALSVMGWRRSARPAGAWLGLGAMSSGALTMSIGLACWHRLGAPYGSAILLAAAASVFLGELLGPVSLRRALERAGELPVERVHTAADEAAS